MCLGNHKARHEGNIWKASTLKKNFICLLSCARPQLQYVEPSTLTIGQAQAPCMGSMESQPLYHQGSPGKYQYFYQICEMVLEGFGRLSIIILTFS